MPPANSRSVTVRQLKLQLEEANTRLAAAQESQEQNAAALEAAQQQIEEQTAALAAVRAQAEAAEAAATQAVLAQQAALNDAGAANAAEPPLQLIPKPRVPRGKSLSIQRSMGLDDDEYSEIRYGIHHLVHNASLAWERDFRHQNVETVARFFHAVSPCLLKLRAREQYP
ncbi:hypothetical protein BN946_scf185007.g70 [Trametes cinnabarina]|uniref:Uncharacterized protein n=1 Tax=Pycnoporus cinnabarinus TaxID=5643 RepID=A0A060SFM2_PYCCI|nr:hypothetical protein BN946_scf185007.g70 [Trametes cinnabarina]